MSEDRTVGLYIDGREVPAASGATFRTIDPATEEPVATVAEAGPEDVDRAVRAARRSLDGPWHDVTPRRRGELLWELSRRIEYHSEELAELESRDTGKPLSRSRPEMDSTVRYFRYYAGAADKIHGDQIPLGPDYVDFTIREPIGVTAHVVPWNAPLNMVARSVAPALATGCTAVVKPAEQTPLTALRLGELTAEVGFPDGVYNVVPGFGPATGGPLTRHPGVASITFTGSVETGREIMRAAAEHIRPVVLELGGKSPIVVLDDADLDVAADEIATGIYKNTGQFCNASSRVVVDETVRESLRDRLVERTEQLTLGPYTDDPDLGPLISREQLERVLDYLELGRQVGARVVTGGGRPPDRDRGFFVQPTVLDEVDHGSRIAQEEIFGPVVSIHPFRGDDEGLRIANDVPYGLAAGIFTRDIDRALRLATGIDAGQIYVNEYFAGDEGTPFGGYKQSGFGREKGLEALRNYTQVKNVAIRMRD